MEKTIDTTVITDRKKTNLRQLDILNAELYLQSHKDILLVFCMGVTCSGKSTLIKHCTDKCDKVGAISVGSEMRKRYDPSRFNGFAAMEDTESEVWDIFAEKLADNISERKKVIIVDGQPRMKSQVKKCLLAAKAIDAAFVFILIHASDECIKRRISTRFGNDLASIDLSVRRFSNDKVQLYDTIVEIIYSGNQVIFFSSEEENYNNEILVKLFGFTTQHEQLTKL